MFQFYFGEWLASQSVQWLCTVQRYYLRVWCATTVVHSWQTICENEYRAWTPRYNFSFSRAYPADKPSFRSTHTAIFYTIPSQSWTCKSPMRLKRLIVPRSCMLSLIALPNFGTDWFLILVDHSLQRMVLLIMIRPAPGLRRHVCGWNWVELIPIWTCSLCVNFSKSAIVADVSTKGRFSAKVTEEGGTKSFPVAPFPCCAMSRVSVMSFLGFRIPV